MNRVSRLPMAGSVLLVLLLSVLMGFQVYGRLIAPAAPLNFDEAAHSLPGFYILRDVMHLDVRAFWGDTHIQTLWPPGFSYLQAPFLALLGRSDESARLFAYIMLVGTVLMSGLIARQIAPNLAPLALLFSALLSLSAPGWLYVSSWAMQETPVAFVVFVVFWLYLRANQTQQLRGYVGTGVGLFFLFLTKYNYAAFAVAAVTGTEIASGWLTKHRFVKPIVHVFALLVPFTLGLLFWFFGGTDIVPTATKWRDFRFFVTNEDSGYAFWSEQNLLFYVRVAANWLMPHGLLVGLTAGLAGVALAKVRHTGVFLLALFFSLGFVLATVHQLKAERYVTPLFPSLWLLAGLGAAFVIKALSAKASVPAKWLEIGATGLALLLFAIVVLGQTLPRLQPVWAGESADGLRAAAQQIVRWQDPSRPVLIIGTFGELSPPLFEWRLRPLPAYTGDQLHGEIQYDAPPGDGDNLQRVAAWAHKNPGTQITVIRVDSGSALFNTNDMRNKNAWRQKLAEQFEMTHTQLGYRLSEQRSLPGGIKVSYYLPLD